MKKKVLIICYSHHASEPRLIKVVRALAQDFDIATAGYSGLIKENRVAFIKLSQKMRKPTEFLFHHNKPVLIRKLGSMTEKIYRKFFRVRNGYFYSYEDYHLLKQQNYDLVIAHHPNSLELSVRLAKAWGAKLVFNCHEYYPLEFDQNPVWMKYDKPIVERLLNKYKEHIDLWLTVSHHIQSEYQRHYNANCFLLYNSKPYTEISYHETDPENIRIIHHGGAMPERKLEQMIEVFEKLPSVYSLDMMLVPTNQIYLDTLKEKYHDVKKLTFREPVPTADIVKEISRYDIGLFFLSDEIFNYKYCLPNKLFEYIQARLCTIITPNPEMKGVVEKYGIGYVSQSYEQDCCLEVFKALDVQKIKLAKQNCEQAALDYDSVKNEEALLKMINQLCAA